MLGIGQRFPAYALTGVVSNDLDHGFKAFNQTSDPGKWQVFFFWPKDRNDVDVFRPSVHDSDGLAIYNGQGEQLWRPVSNPRDLQRLRLQPYGNQQQLKAACFPPLYSDLQHG